MPMRPKDPPSSSISTHIVRSTSAKTLEIIHSDPLRNVCRFVSKHGCKSHNLYFPEGTTRASHCNHYLPVETQCRANFVSIQAAHTRPLSCQLKHSDLPSGGTRLRP